MGKAGTKKIVLVGVWVVLLIGLVIGIKVIGGRFNGVQPDPKKPVVNPMPRLDPVKLEAAWPQILANAAAPARGNAGTRYTLAEFGDFQCPQCGKARPILEKMLAQNPAEVNLIFLHRPIAAIHDWALPSGQAAIIAAKQGKFWPMYDVLYTHQDDLESGFYGDYAIKAGLDKAQFQKAFDAGQGQAELGVANKFADSLDVMETPTILVRDNAAHTVTLFVGMNTEANHKNGVPYDGLEDLVANPPWKKSP